MLYDEDWNYIKTVELQDDAQWSMGSEYNDGLIYIAYHKGPHEYGDVYVDIYDTEWDLQETIEVTDVGERVEDDILFAQHPWLDIDGDKMFVIYTIGREKILKDSLERTLTCMLSVYEKK